MISKRFLKDTTERVIATVAATALAVLGAGAPWRTAGEAALLAGGVTLLKCLAASRSGDPTSASAVDLRA